MPRYDIYESDGTTLRAASISLAVAAGLAELDETEIEWAIEEEGRCDGPEFIIVEAGDEAPGKYEGG